MMNEGNEMQSDYDKFNNQQGNKIDQFYDEEIQEQQLKDEYADQIQVNGQTSHEYYSQAQTNSQRTSSATTKNTANNEQNISINLNDNKSENDIHKPKHNPSKAFQIQSNPKSHFQRYMGNTWGCLNFRGDPIISTGPHFCLFLISWSCMTGFSYFLTQKISLNKGEFWYYLTIIVGGLQSLSFLLTALINPGILTAKAQGVSNPRLQNYCSKCDVNQLKGSYHCPDCDVCIIDFDHHCPWTGKCIGGGNMSLFKLFITTTIFWFFYSIILLIS